MSDLLVIVPSMGRPENAKALLEAFAATDAQCDLLFALELNDPKYHDYFQFEHIYPYEVIAMHSPTRGMAYPLNRAASFHADNYEFFGFMGDDHRPRTHKWDNHVEEVLGMLQTGIAYGNDLHQGEGLPTAAFMTKDIVIELDGMVPQTFRHLYIDNFWLKLGQDLKRLQYLPMMIIEHLHPVFGTAQMDEGYKAVNAPEIYSADAHAFSAYIASQEYANLILTLRSRFRVCCPPEACTGVCEAY